MIPLCVAAVAVGNASTPKFTLFTLTAPTVTGTSPLASPSLTPLVLSPVFTQPAANPVTGIAVPTVPALVLNCTTTLPLEMLAKL